MPRALRRQGHPRVRQGPHALHRPLPRHRAAEVRARSPSRCPTTSSGRRSSPRARSSSSRPDDALARLVPRDATATKERLLREAERLFATARALPGDGARDHRGGRAAQRLRAQLPLRVARRAARRDPDPPRRPHRRRARRAARPRRVATRRTRELVDALVVPYAANLRDARRTATTCASSPSCRRSSAPGASRRPGTGPYLHRDPRAARSATAGASRSRCGASGSSR